MKMLQVILASIAMMTLGATAAEESTAEHKGSKQCNSCCKSAEKCDACCHDKGKGKECRACCFEKK